MTTRFLLIILLLMPIHYGYSQNQVPLRQSIENRLNRAWFGDGTIIQILENKENCENLVKRLKISGKETEELKSLYDSAKNAYNALLDTMMIDVTNTVSVGDLFRVLATSNDRRAKYMQLGEQADAVCFVFKQSAEAALNDKMGLIDDLINWSKVFIPSWIRTLAEELRDSLKQYYSNKIRSLRFNDWGNIR